MVGIYVRVSTRDQAIYGYSIEEQINLLVDYCKQNKLGKYRIYLDEGLSGTSMKRTRLNILLEDIKDKEINIILVYRLDRISRSSQDTEYLMNFFYENKCDFISVNEYFRFNTAL